jgi:hypothetical protein
MAYVCDLSYLGGRDKRIGFQASPGKRLLRLYLKQQAGYGSGGAHLCSYAGKGGREGGGGGGRRKKTDAISNI